MPKGFAKIRAVSSNRTGRHPQYRSGDSPVSGRGDPMDGGDPRLGLGLVFLASCFMLWMLVVARKDFSKRHERLAWWKHLGLSLGSEKWHFRLMVALVGLFSRAIAL